MPDYVPEQPVSGTIRIWGHGSLKHDFMGPIVRRWAADFARYQPGVRIVNRMYGTASAIGALYTGAGDIAILGEELDPAAARAFRKVRHYPPFGIQIATGSLDVRYFDYAHVIFVNRANPISRLTLAQLDAIFGSEHRRGLENIRRWGRLGLSGAWSKQPIQPYGWSLDDFFAQFFQNAVLGGSHHWACSYREFHTTAYPDGSPYDEGEKVAEAVAKNRYGIGISSLLYANPQVKPLALAARTGGPYYAPTLRNLIDQSYPLTRYIPAYIDRPPGQLIEPRLREFLRYLLSRQGQEATVQDGGYLPLSPAATAAQLKLLDAAWRPASAPAANPRASSDARSAATAPDPDAPVYRPDPNVAGTIRIWGDDQMTALVTRWETGFRRYQPQVRFETRLLGTGTAMAGLYCGVADVAFMGRDATPKEIKGFQWVFRHPPLPVDVATGSRDAAGRSPAIIVFVHRTNPLARLTLAQLQAIVACQPPEGSRPLRTWGQLGLVGAWRDRPIHVYTYDTATGTGLFLQRVVMHDSRKWAWTHVTEFRGSVRPDGSAVSVSQQVGEAVARDPGGLGFATWRAAGPRVHAVDLATGPAGPFCEATASNLVGRTYPLARLLPAYLNREPGRPLNPPLRAFLRYILSRQGQDDIVRQGGFLPLSPETIRRERAKLE